jgi:hypothetical protein
VASEAERGVDAPTALLAAFRGDDEIRDLSSMLA